MLLATSLPAAADFVPVCHSLNVTWHTNGDVARAGVYVRIIEDDHQYTMIEPNTPTELCIDTQSVPKDGVMVEAFQIEFGVYVDFLAQDGSVATVPVPYAGSYVLAVDSGARDLEALHQMVVIEQFGTIERPTSTATGWRKRQTKPK